jgi:hypothetical protein
LRYFFSKCHDLIISIACAQPSRLSGTSNHEWCLHLDHI